MKSCDFNEHSLGKLRSTSLHFFSSWSLLEVSLLFIILLVFSPHFISSNVSPLLLIAFLPWFKHLNWSKFWQVSPLLTSFQDPCHWALHFQIQSVFLISLFLIRSPLQSTSLPLFSDFNISFPFLKGIFLMKWNEIFHFLWTSLGQGLCHFYAFHVISFIFICFAYFS